MFHTFANNVPFVKMVFYGIAINHEEYKKITCDDIVVVGRSPHGAEYVGSLCDF